MPDKGKNSQPEIYDISVTEKEILEHRYNRRLALRQEFLKLNGDPNSRNHVFDAAIQRQYTAYFAYEHLFRPKLKNLAWTLMMTLLPISVLTYIVKGSRDEKEHRYRTGQVSYKNRDWKYV